MPGTLFLRKSHWFFNSTVFFTSIEFVQAFFLARQMQSDAHERTMHVHRWPH